MNVFDYKIASKLDMTRVLQVSENLSKNGFCNHYSWLRFLTDDFGNISVWELLVDGNVCVRMTPQSGSLFVDVHSVSTINPETGEWVNESSFAGFNLSLQKNDRSKFRDSCMQQLYDDVRQMQEVAKEYIR